jgi:hypothetical protein
VIIEEKSICQEEINQQTRTPRSEIENAFALSLGLGKNIPLQFLSNALKTYNKLFNLRHLFGQIWAPIKNQDVASIKQV